MGKSKEPIYEHFIHGLQHKADEVLPRYLCFFFCYVRRERQQISVFEVGYGSVFSRYGSLDPDPYENNLNHGHLYSKYCVTNDPRLVNRGKKPFC